MNLLVENVHGPKKMFWRWVVFIGIVIVLLLGTFFAYKTVYVKSTISVPTLEQAPIGTIFFSSITKEAGTGNLTGIDSGIIDVAMNRVSPNAVQTLAVNNSVAMQVNFSRNLGYVTYLGLPKEASSSDGQSLSVYRSSVEEKMESYDDLKAALEFKNALSFAPDDQDYLRMTPVVSAQGDVLYASLDKQTINSLGTDFGAVPAQSWSIYDIDVDGVKKQLTSGISPKWIGDNAFAFLRNDGVYTFDMNTGVTTLVWKHEGAPLTLANGFTVSNDGWNFALAEPTLAQVTVVHVKDWDAKIFMPLVLSNVVASNPLFSLNNSLLALVVSSKTDAEVKQSSVAYYDIFQKKFLLKTVPIDEASIDGIYLTGWY